MKNVSIKSLSALIFVFLFFLASCNDDKIDFSSNDSQSVQDEAASDGYFEDADDMATLAVAADGSTSSGARESASGRAGIKPTGDFRFSCAEVTFNFAENNSPTIPHGFITINFGSSCTDIKGNVRSGIIYVEFIGKRFYPESKIITTFEEYFINGVKIEGTRTVTNVTGSIEDRPKFSIVIVGGKATWPDGSFATREVNRSREWIRGANPLQDEWIVDGTTAGTNRNGATYQVEITKPLVYKRECAIGSRVFMAVEGTKVLTTDVKIITIDYGSGDCDKTVTVTINGVTRTIEVKGNI